MTTYLKAIIIAAFSVLSFSAQSYEFKHLKLKGQLAKETEKSSDTFGAKSITDEVKPALIERINEIIGNNYNQIGEDQATPLILNHDLGGGVLNFSGFTWNKPSGNIKLYANREVTPDMFSTNYIVHDSLTVSIDASSYLTELREDDMIDISDSDIGAFVGVGFKRVYHYYHFAESYKKGISADYSKLFLSFSKFTVDSTLNMGPYQILKMEDKFYFNAGGKFSYGTGLNLSAGVLVDVAFENKLTLQSVGPNDNRRSGEFLRVSQDKSWNVSAAAQVSVQLDFFNLLKLTLLQGDLEYQYGKSHKKSLSFYENDVDTIMNSYGHHKEYKKIITGKQDEPDYWQSNIVQLEDRVNQNFNSKYSVLLFGTIRKRETQQIKAIKDGIETVFYKHYSQSTRYIQNLLSRLLNIIVVRLFDFDIGTQNFAETSQKMKVEYKYNQSLDKEIVEGDEDFSLNLTQKFQAGRTHRWIDRKLKKTAVSRIKNWSNLDSKISKWVDREKLRGPLSFESKIHIETSGLNFFHSLSVNHLFESIVRVCKSRRLKDWLNPSKRAKMIRRVQFGRNACVKKLGIRYLDYRNYVQSTNKRNLKKFRKFIGKYFSKTRHIAHLQSLFGEENVFITGSLSAKTNKGLPFNTYFKSGHFKGLGVIDTFMRDRGTTTPVK